MTLWARTRCIHTTNVISFRLAMARLSASDLEATLRFLGEAASVDGPDPFPTWILDRLRDLVRCDFADYFEQDRVHRRTFLYEGCSRTRDAMANESGGDDDYWGVSEQHPVCAYRDRTGDHSAHKPTDFVTAAQLKRLDVYHVTFRPRRIRDMMSLGLPAPKTHIKAFSFKTTTRDFGERERLLLNLLQPHLSHCHGAAADRRALAALDVEHNSDGGAFVVLGRDRRIEFANAAAQQLLHRYFGHGSGSRLPERIERWLTYASRPLDGDAAGSRHPEQLSVATADTRLTVRRVGDTLLLDEDASGLTRREREIVELLAEGQSNAEVATALWISPLTVRKHLENIYAKLGVPNRAAAVVRARAGGGSETLRSMHH